MESFSQELFTLLKQRNYSNLSSFILFVYLNIPYVVGQQNLWNFIQ